MTVLEKTLAGLQGSTLSDHCMTTGFRPLQLPTFLLSLLTKHNAQIPLSNGL